MEARLVDELPAGKDWRYEPKWDGFRCLAFKRTSKVELIEMEDQFRPYLAEKDFQVAFVSLDKEPAKAIEWFQGNLKQPDELLNHLYLDGDFTNADKLQVDSFPMTIVVGRDGKIAKVQRGFKEGDDSTKRLVEAAAQLLKAH